MLITNLLFFIISCLVLIIAGTFLVKSLSKIAEFLGISEFTAAFIIMAIATSIPELFVGISSAILKNPQLSLGNIIGSNILNLTLITGIIVLVGKEIKLGTQKISEDIYFMLGAIVLIIFLYLIGKSLSRADGAILLIFFILNMYRKFKKKTKYKAKFKAHVKKWEIILNVSLFIIALLILFFSSKYTVKYASLLAIDLNLPKIVIGLFLISFATTLPELVFGVSAIRLDHKEMSIGDQTGTIIANSCLILGAVSLIYPIEAEFFQFLISSFFMFISAFIFYTFAKTGKKLETVEGISLILIYVLFVIIEFFIK